LQALASPWKLDSEQAYFKLAMIGNYKKAMVPPFDVNPLTRLWRSIDIASLCIFHEYKKLAKMVVIHIMDQYKTREHFLLFHFLKIICNILLIRT
jgi:hypothetical protein